MKSLLRSLISTKRGLRHKVGTLRHISRTWFLGNKKLNKGINRKNRERMKKQKMNILSPQSSIKRA